MKNLVLLVTLIVSCVCASAQKVFFIYLQSDNYSPFYVKMNDKIYSSTTSGYLILSNLVDSTYNFAIGFPSSQPESRFNISLNGKDKGFLIKNFDTGLGLFDLQNLSITKEIKDNSPGNVSYIRRDDEFSSMLAKAAKDTSLLYAVVYTRQPDVAVQQPLTPAPEENKKVEEILVKSDSGITIIPQTAVVGDVKKEDVGAEVQSGSDIKKEAQILGVAAVVGSQRDTTSAAKQEPLQTTGETVTVTTIDSTAATTTVITNTHADTATRIATDSTALVEVPADATFKRSVVKKHSESSTSEGFGLVFFDNIDGVQDTVRLLIPNPPIIFKESPQTDTSAVAKEFIHVDELKKEAEVTPPIVVAVKGDAAVKTQCKSVATSNDFFKLRKNMASENSDDAMVAQAKKIFKTKCFTTEQVKNLSSLFLTSAGKYEFFDGAYGHVSDQQNFSSLESEIKDDYYLKRFRALVGD
jgi:hypothetical protein